MIKILRFTKLDADNRTPIEAAWLEIPDECFGQDEEKFIVSRIYGTEAIFAEMML